MDKSFHSWGFGDLFSKSIVNWKTFLTARQEMRNFSFAFFNEKRFWNYIITVQQQ